MTKQIVKGTSRGKIIPKKIATSFKLRRPSLENDKWAVYTIDENIQTGISEFLAESGEEPYVTEEITYREKQWRVFLVPFSIAEFLKKNRSKFPDYISFHRRKRSGNSSSGDKYGPWKMWMEGSKTPNAFLKNILENWGN